MSPDDLPVLVCHSQVEMNERFIVPEGNVPRSRHTATLLPNGLVLVAGGRDSAPHARVTERAISPPPTTNDKNHFTSLGISDSV